MWICGGFPSESIRAAFDFMTKNYVLSGFSALARANRLTLYYAALTVTLYIMTALS